MVPGSLVALVTPMTPSGHLDLDALRGLLRWHIEAGTDGIVALGTTGESSVLTFDERARVLEVCHTELAGRMPLMVGTGTIDPESVIKMNRQAQELGADSCLVVTPYYTKPTQRGLAEWFAKVADATDLPLLLYNVPGRTAVDMRPETVATLAAHPNIFGIKEATGELERVEQLRRLIDDVDPGFMLFSGEDSNAHDFTLRGGDGVISVLANVVPAEQAAVFQAALAGDAESAARLHQPLALLAKRLFIQPNPIPVKYAVAALGRMESAQRLPLTELDAEFQPALLEAMAAVGLKAGKY